MSLITPNVGDVADAGYRFGTNETLFRGQAPDLSKPYTVFLGAGETYGQYVEMPFPNLLGRELPIQCVNWGVPGGGPTHFLRDPVLQDACNKARLCVITAGHAWAISNRLYTVLHRDNSAISDVSDQLIALFPNVDVDSFERVRPMLVALQNSSPDNFKVLEMEIREAWLARMREMVERIETRTVLFVMGDHLLDDPSLSENRRIGPELVSRVMLNRLAGYVDHFVVYEASEEAQSLDGEDRIYDESDATASLSYPGERMHVEAAELLFPILRPSCNDAPDTTGNMGKLKQILGF